MDTFIFDNIFNNTEEEIIFNNDEIDEDEIENNGKNNDMEKEQFETANDIEETKTNEDQQHEQSKRLRKPNTKYDDYYQFSMNDINKKNIISKEKHMT